MGAKEVGSVKSGARILDLIELIARHDRPVSLAEIDVELGIPKSSALMLLRTLVAKNYVERDENGRYHLDRIFQSSASDWVGGRVAMLRKLARPLMQDLAEAVQETVVLGVLLPNFEVEVVEKARSPREVRYEIDVGVQYPAYCTSMGRAILSFLDTPVIEHYLHTVPRTMCTPKTTIDLAALLGILEDVRREGYAINIEEHIDGASSVAAPLMDNRGHILGSLNVGCVTANFITNRRSIIASLVSTAARLNEELARRSGSVPMAR